MLFVRPRPPDFRMLRLAKVLSPAFSVDSLLPSVLRVLSVLVAGVIVLLKLNSEDETLVLRPDFSVDMGLLLPSPPSSPSPMG